MKQKSENIKSSSSEILQNNSQAHKTNEFENKVISLSLNNISSSHNNKHHNSNSPDIHSLCFEEKDMINSNENSEKESLSEINKNLNKNSINCSGTEPNGINIENNSLDQQEENESISNNLYGSKDGEQNSKISIEEENENQEGNDQQDIIYADCKNVEINDIKLNFLKNRSDDSEKTINDNDSFGNISSVGSERGNNSFLSYDELIGDNEK